MNKNNQIIITSTDQIVLNTLLYLYNLNKKPVSIADLEEVTSLRYTTIRYSVNKFCNLGILERVKSDDKVTRYLPKTRVILPLSKNYVLIVLDAIAFPYITSTPIPEEQIGVIISIKDAPKEIKEAVRDIVGDLSLLIEYRELLKEHLFRELYKQYLSLRKKKLQLSEPKKS